jgi:phage tail sheath protein FI
MPNTSTPGIYIEEVSGGARPIQAVGTSTAGFIGEAPNPNARVQEPVAIENWSQFVREFVADGTPSTLLAQAVYGFFLNGGRRCYVLNVGAGQPISGGGSGRRGLDLFKEIDEIAIVAAPGRTDAADYEALLEHCEKQSNRVAILDAPRTVKSIEQLTRVPTPTTDESPTTTVGEQLPGLRPAQSDRGYAAFYFPWIGTRDPISNDLVVVPPSGHIAGIWARTDTTRGVHKAPANEAVRGALSVSYRVTDEEQSQLNPNGINCIRSFAAEGIRVWGARTIASGSSEWRYLNVRRLFTMIEVSIARSTRWIVFEPNDQTLWKSIRRDISAFLTRLWRDGALMGRTPEQAFFVQCDEETNPPDEIDAGRVTTIIGIAPVKPAEFIVFRISQSSGSSEVSQS